MKTKHTYPPNYNKIKQFMPLTENNIFCYGDTLYNPTKKDVPEDIIYHEQMHQKQQEGISPDDWWDRYLTDKEFRKQMEVEAYAIQYKFVKKFYPSKAHKEALQELANNLSVLYNLDISVPQAETLIRKYNAVESREKN